MLLVFDIGNTNITGVVYRGEKPGERFSFETAQADRGDVLQRAIGSDAAHLTAAVCASVVPRAKRQLAETVRSTTGLLMASVRSLLPEPVPLHVPEPATVGDDRIANVIGATALVDGPAIVADLGTAVTIDVVTADGGYGGGVIGPGIRLAARALNQATAKLPLVDLTVPPRVRGVTTDECCRSGLTYGIGAMVSGLVARLRHEEDLADAPLLVTGGQAMLLAPLLPAGSRMLPDLTLEGIRLWYRRAKEQRRKS